MVERRDFEQRVVTHCTHASQYVCKVQHRTAWSSTEPSFWVCTAPSRTEWSEPVSPGKCFFFLASLKVPFS